MLIPFYSGMCCLGAFKICCCVVVADNVKALYRRGKAHVGAWNPKEARADFERVAELDPSMAKVVQKELSNLDALEKQKISDDRALFEGKIFG